MPNSTDIGKYPVLLLDAFHKAEKEDPVVIECASPDAARNLFALLHAPPRPVSQPRALAHGAGDVRRQAQVLHRRPQPSHLQPNVPSPTVHQEPTVNTATLIQRTLELAAQLDIETTDVLLLAQKILDVTLLNLDDEGPPRHILGLCKDTSLLLISIRPDKNDPALESWDVFSFSDPGLFEQFLNDPACADALPPEAHGWLLSAYQRVHLMETLEPGHA